MYAVGKNIWRRDPDADKEISFEWYKKAWKE